MAKTIKGLQYAMHNLLLFIDILTKYNHIIINCSFHNQLN